MSDIAIRVENLSKRYRIGLKEELHDTLGGAIVDFLKKPASNLRRLRSLSQFAIGEESKSVIWALKDVSFEIRQGQVLGIIGRNGAGKSTLLKILSRITEPTFGQAKIYGRVSSLLEVGTGFHPELTGRENIYLNGTILGMRKVEVDRKFDEIVEFSGIEKFIDTPVKRYSSGMKVRLAFSIAAHLEPEVLMIDEVLAVGDAGFQQRCLGRMQDIAYGGRTVLFVSHDLSAIDSLCDLVGLLQNGRLIRTGLPSKVIGAYLEDLKLSRNIPLSQRTDRKGNRKLRFVDVTFRDKSTGKRVDILISGMESEIVLTYEASGPNVQNPMVTVGFQDMHKHGLFLCRSDIINAQFGTLPPQGRFVCHLPRLPLQPGKYNLLVSCRLNGVLADNVQDAAEVNVAEGDFYKTGRLPSADRAYSCMLVDYQWAFEEQ